jgi:hypothetical protein
MLIKFYNTIAKLGQAKVVTFVAFKLCFFEIFSTALLRMHSLEHTGKTMGMGQFNAYILYYISCF